MAYTEFSEEFEYVLNFQFFISGWNKIEKWELGFFIVWWTFRFRSNKKEISSLSKVFGQVEFVSL
jgi:hypothetical protein